MAIAKRVTVGAMAGEGTRRRIGQAAHDRLSHRFGRRNAVHDVQGLTLRPSKGYELSPWGSVLHLVQTSISDCLCGPRSLLPLKCRLQLIEAARIETANAF